MDIKTVSFITAAEQTIFLGGIIIYSYVKSPLSLSFFRIFPYARSSISCTVSGSDSSCSIAKSIKDCFLRSASTGTPSFSFRANVSKHSGQNPRCAATSIRSLESKDLNAFRTAFERSAAKKTCSGLVLLS